MSAAISTEHAGVMLDSSFPNTSAWRRWRRWFGKMIGDTGLTGIEIAVIMNRIAGRRQENQS
jgi:hypothetical protein